MAREPRSRGEQTVLVPLPAGHFRADAASAAIVPDVEKLTVLTRDNPVQVENGKRLREPVESRLAELTKVTEFAKQNDLADGIAVLRQANASD